MSPGSVLHCIPTMSGGGAERQLAYLAGELTRLGWSVHVAVMRRGANWTRLEASGAVIHELPARSSYDPALFFKLQAVAAAVRPRLIQTWLLQMEVLGGAVALRSHTPWVFSERSSLGAYPVTVKNLARRFAARRATAIVSNSRGGDEYWRDRVGSRVRRFVIPNGLPLAEIDATPAASLEAFGLRPDLPLLLFAGRLDAEKNIETLLAALDAIVVPRQFQMLWCGEGSRRPLVERWIAGHGLQARVKAVGYIPDLWGLMKRANAVISPSLFEGSPNVVLEAMACGAPLVVSNIPAHREFLTDREARLVDPRSSADIAAAIGDVLDHPEAASDRARRARTAVAPFALPAIAQQYSVVYQRLLENGR